MDELTQTSSRLGQFSIAIAIINLFILGVLILIRLKIPDGWMDLPEGELEKTARWMLLGNWAIVLFPVFAIVGLIIGSIAYFHPNYAKFYSLAGIIFNGLEFALWIIGIIGWQLVFHLDRFYVK